MEAGDARRESHLGTPRVFSRAHAKYGEHAWKW